MPKLAALLDAGSNKITNLGTPTASTDAATKAYVDANSGGASPYMYKSGLYLIAGGVFGKNGTVAATIVAGSQGTIYYVPLLLPKAISSVASMSVRVATSQSGASVRLGIYTSDANGMPSALLGDFGSVSLAGSGIVSTSIGTPVNLPAGVVWCCMFTDNASSSSGAVNAGLGADLALPATTIPASGLTPCGFSAVLGSISAFPSTCDQSQLGTQFIVPLLGITLP